MHHCPSRLIAAPLQTQPDRAARGGEMHSGWAPATFFESSLHRLPRLTAWRSRICTGFDTRWRTQKRYTPSADDVAWNDYDGVQARNSESYRPEECKYPYSAAHLHRSKCNLSRPCYRLILYGFLVFQYIIRIYNLISSEYEYIHSQCRSL